MQAAVTLDLELSDPIEQSSPFLCDIYGVVQSAYPVVTTADSVVV